MRSCIHLGPALVQPTGDASALVVTLPFWVVKNGISLGFFPQQIAHLKREAGQIRREGKAEDSQGRRGMWMESVTNSPSSDTLLL